MTRTRIRNKHRLYAGLFLPLLLIGFQLRAQAQLKMTVGTPVTSDFPVIHISVHVQDSSGTYSNLLPSNFSLKENGQPMLPLQLDCQTKDNTPPLSVCVLLDCSTSMSYYEDPNKPYPDVPDSTKWKNAKADITLAFNNLRPQDAAAFITFTQFLTLQAPFTTDKKLLDDVVAGLYLKTNQGTHIFDALWMADTLTRREPPRRIVILITDGEDQGSTRKQAAVISALKTDTIAVYSIGLGVSAQGAAALQAISNGTGGKCYLAPTTAQLPSIITDMIQSIFYSDCVLTYTTTDTCRSGGTRAIDVSTTVNGHSATASTQYTVPDLRSRASFAMVAPPIVTAPGHYEFPLLIGGEIRGNESTSLALTLGFDSTFVSFTSFVANPSLFSPGPVITQQTPGSITIGMTASTALTGIPYGEADTLGWVSFDIAEPSANLSTQLTVSVESLSQNCDAFGTGNTVMFSVHRCPALLKVDIASPKVEESGVRLWLPLRMVYPLDVQQSLSYSFQFQYDTTYLRYYSFMKLYTVSENLDVQISEQSPGVLQVAAPEGTPVDSSGTLLLLGFDSKREKETHVVSLSFLNPTLIQPCLPSVQFADTSFILEGICTPLVVKRDAFALQQNHPNPISSADAPTTSIEFSISGTGRASLDVYDMAGRRVAMLIDADLPAGVHTVSFSPSQLPKGVYSYILREGANIAVKKMIWLQ